MRDDLGIINDHLHPGALPRLQVTVATVGGPKNGSFPNYSVFSSNGEADVILRFQDGPILEVGINGVTNEALLAIVIDRLRDFQAGDFSCRENALALTHIETGLLWLHKRTADRIGRNVEGRMEK